MKIGIVTTWFERGAAYVSKQYEQLLSENHEVFIYARGGEQYAIGDPKWDRENVWWGKRKISPMSTYIDKKDFIKWLKKKNIELVIFNEQHWLEPVMICNKLNIKTVAYIDYYTEETIPFFEIYDALFCNTKRHFSAFKWHPQVYYIPWGTNTEIFKPIKIKSTNKDKIVFFHSCGMNPRRKGTHLLLDALELLEEYYEQIEVIIHTQIDLKKFFPNRIDQINKLINNKVLKIINKTVSSPGLYYMGDVYVYPSILEGIGLTVAEAVSCGLPVIVPNDAPMNEFIKDNINGKLVEVDKFFARADGYYWPQNNCNINSLKEKMIFYIQNRNELTKYKKIAREYALNNLNWENNKNLLVNIICNIQYRKKNIKDLHKKLKFYYNKKIPGFMYFDFMYNFMYYIYKKVK